MNMRLSSIMIISVLAGCGGPPKPDRVSLSLAPELIGSASGILAAEATVAHGEETLDGWQVVLHVDYNDRKGAAHSITDISGKSDKAGVVRASFNPRAHLS